MTSRIQSPSQVSPRGSLFSIISFTCSAAEYTIFCFVKTITTSVEFIAGVLDICRLFSPLTLAYALTPRALLTFAYNISAFARSVVLLTLSYIWTFVILCVSPIRTLKSAAHALVAFVSSLVSSLSKHHAAPADTQPTQSRPVPNKPKLRPFSVGRVSGSRERPSTYHEAWRVQKHDSSSSQSRYSVVQENGTQPRSQVVVIEREHQVRQRKPRGTTDHQRRRSQNANMVRYLVTEKARLQKAIEDLKAQVQTQDGHIASMGSPGTSPRMTPSLTLTNPEGQSSEYFDGQHGPILPSSTAEREKLESKIAELSRQLETVLSDKEQLELQLKSSKQTCLRCQDSTTSAPHTCEGASIRAESRGPDSQRETVFPEPEEYRPVFALNDEVDNDDLPPSKPSKTSLKSSDSRQAHSEDVQPSSASQVAEYSSLGIGTPSTGKHSIRRKIFHRSPSVNSIAHESSVVDKTSPSRSPSMLMSKVRKLTNRGFRTTVRSPSE